jgi:succinyl-CoA synthetase beta subunit
MSANVKLFEHEAKSIARNFALPIPRGYVVSTPDEAKKAFDDLGKRSIVKSQVLVAGRKKAGGIKFASTPQEAWDVAKELLGMHIRGEPVKKLLVEEAVAARRELYVGIAVDRTAGCYTILASTEGGIDIEEVASKSPEKIVRLPVNPLHGLRDYEARYVAQRLGFSGKQLIDLTTIISKIYKMCIAYDCELLESNPLIEIEQEGFVAADFRALVDDNSLFRHREFEERVKQGIADLTPLELKAHEKGLAYVELDGNIGVIGNGAGLVMATLDMINYYGGKPANFCDAGAGGATIDRIEAALELVLSNERVKALFINVLAGITRCDDVAKGIVATRDKSGIKIPIVIRMVGTNEEEGRRILEKAGIPFLDSMEEGARETVAGAKR